MISFCFVLILIKVNSSEIKSCTKFLHLLINILALVVKKYVNSSFANVDLIGIPSLSHKIIPFFLKILFFYFIYSYIFFLYIYFILQFLYEYLFY
jgi:hypothetical protein